MRVLHLTRDFPPRHSGGISTAVEGVVAALRVAGVHNHVVSYDGWRPRGAASAPPQTHGGILRVSGPNHRPAVLAFAAKHMPDVVHVHDALLFDDAASLAVPSVFTVHVAHAVLSRLRRLTSPTLSEVAEARAIMHATRVTVPSRAVARDLAIEDAHVLPFGVASVHRNEGTLPPRSRAVVLFAGRLADIKGLNELFDAMETVITALPEAKLRIAGGLTTNRRAERRWRRRFEASASPRLQEATTWLGWLTPTALAAEYQTATLLAAPSWYETYGLAALEAMGHGLAVVASDAGGLAESITHRRTGWLVPPRESQPLAAAMVKLLSDPELAQRLGARAAEDVAAQRRWPDFAGELIRVYRACVASSV